MGPEQSVFRVRGCPATWMPLAIGREPMAPRRLALGRMVWTWQGTASGMGCRNSRAVFLLALSARGVTADWLVRSMPTNRQGLPLTVGSAAMSM
jgi:hypothetical protein